MKKLLSIPLMIILIVLLALITITIKILELVDKEQVLEIDKLAIQVSRKHLSRRNII